MPKLKLTIIMLFAATLPVAAQQYENSSGQLAAEHVESCDTTAVAATGVDMTAPAADDAIDVAAIAELNTGDSDRAADMSPNDARSQRGFSTTNTFVPKGQWIFGGSASYSTHRNDDYKLLVVEGISSDGYTVKVSPMIAISPKDNMAVGVRFIYGRTMLDMDNASLKFGEADSGVNINVDYMHQIKQEYTGSVFWRQYIPIGHSNRFAIFTEIQLCFSGGQSSVVAEDGVLDGYQKYRGTYATHFGTSVGLQPGIVAFATNNMAFEISIGVFGIAYEHTRQIHNRVEVGNVKTSNMNFKVNLLSIGFGVSFYL